MDLTILILYFVGALVLAAIIFYGTWFGAMYTRIPTKKLERIIKLSDLDFKKTFMDLGAGLGTASFEAAHTGAEVIAVEIDPFKVALMKTMLRYNNTMYKASAKNLAAGAMIPTKYAYRHLNMEIRRGNLLKQNFGEADIIFCYLSPALMPKVGEKAKQEMKQSAKLISTEYRIPGWKETYVDEENKIYVYQK